jgi:hypothetical protein
MRETRMKRNYKRHSNGKREGVSIRIQSWRDSNRKNAPVLEDKWAQGKIIRGRMERKQHATHKEGRPVIQRKAKGDEEIGEKEDTGHHN